MQQDKVDHAEQQAETLRKDRQRWDLDIKIKQRLERMAEDKEAFQSLIVSRREEEFEQLRVSSLCFPWQQALASKFNWILSRILPQQRTGVF